MYQVYVNDRSCLDRVLNILENTPGIDLVLDEAGKEQYNLNYEGSGELVAIADSHSRFTYYYWLDDKLAPDFARTVNIHRKPSYDPVELFIDPRLNFLQEKVGLTLLKKKLGYRYLMNVIPLNASLVKGSHPHLTDSVSRPQK